MSSYIKSNSTLLTPEQVAGILQVHVLTIYAYIHQGRLNAVRLGRNYRIVPEDLALFIESNRVKKRQAIGVNSSVSERQMEAHVSGTRRDSNCVS